MRTRRVVLFVALLLLVLGSTVAGVRTLIRDYGADADVAPPDEQPDPDEAASERSTTRRERVHLDESAVTAGAATGAYGGSVDDADADGAADSHDAAGGGATEATSTDAVSTDPVRTLRGRVTDAVTGAPVEGVHVSFVSVRDGFDTMGYGSTSDAAGLAAHEVPRDFGGPGARYELRVRRKGYQVLVIPLADSDGESGDVAISLEPLRHPPVPGRVVVYATHPDGSQITGPALVSGRSELDSLWQWAEAGDAGTFVLEGVPPGHWELRFETADAWVETIVPDGGETRVQLVGPAMPWPPAMTAEEFEREHAELSVRGGPSRSDANLSDEMREQSEWRRQLAVQRLETDWRAVRPRRDVTFAGLPRDGPAWLRVQSAQGPQTFWRRRIRGGAVHAFPLTIERWSFRIERSERNGPWHRAEIVAGEGVQKVTLLREE